MFFIKIYRKSTRMTIAYYINNFNKIYFIFKYNKLYLNINN